MTTMIIFFMLYCKRGNNNCIFDVARSSCNTRECATTINQPLQDARMQQSYFFVMLLITRMTARIVFPFSRAQGAMTTVDCNRIAQGTSNFFHWCGSTTSRITKVQGVSNKIDCNAMTTTSTTRQSCFSVVSRGAMTIKDKGEGRTKQLPCNNQNFMLLFTGCGNNHIVPHYGQQCKYAEVGVGEYAGKGCTLPKESTASLPKTVCTAPRVSIARMLRRLHLLRRATTSLSSKRATTNPLPRMETWLGKTMSPSPQGQLATYLVQGNDEPLDARAIGRVRCAREQQAPCHKKQLGHGLWQLWRR